MYKIMSPFLNYAICGLRPKTRGHNTQGWAGLLFSCQGLGLGCPDLLLGQFRAPMLTEFGPFFTNFSAKNVIFFWLSQAGLGNPKSGLNRIGPLKTNGPWAKYWVHPTLLHTYVLLSHFWPYRLALTKAPSFLSRSSMRPFRVRLKLSFSLFLRQLHHRHNQYLFLSILSHTCFFLKIVIISKVSLLATLQNV